MRRKENLNVGWVFTKEDESNFSKCDIPKEAAEETNIPHTWNALDGEDGGNDYYRAGCWYQKRMDIPQISENEELYLEFKAVNSVADVYLDGEKLGSHAGGYSAFRFDISSYAGRKNVLLSVRADNSDNPDVYPRTADFTFFGGIYRDVTLHTVPKTHFAMMNHASCGIFIDTEIAEKTAKVIVRSEVENAKDALMVCYEILDADGICVAEKKQPWETEVIMTLSNPNLWNGRRSSHMYTLRASLLAEDGEAKLDVQDVPFGIRSIGMDTERGFFLNGESYPLHGVARHQDRRDKGWAIGAAEHEEDIEMICEIGATSIRLAHYQHEPYFYDLCDKNGLVIWAEIPFISQMSKTEGANENLRQQMKELVLQNYNHPSICFWGLQNETTIHDMQGTSEDPELTAMVRELHELVKTLNPARMTTQACLGNVSPENGIVTASDLVSYNHYYGWYVGEPEDLGKWFDDFHDKYPDTIVGLSEYGGDGSVRYHSDKPKANDYTEEYQALLHEKLEEILWARPYIWSHYVWNMFDFGSDRRDEGGAPGINQKGLVTYDRKHKKDAFYLYKSYWSDEPFVHICGHTYVNRTAKEREIKVYSNQPSVTLYMDGNVIATIESEHVFCFKVDFTLGEHTLCAVAGDVKEELVLNGVEKYDKSYKMTELEGKAGIVNWFENADDFHFVSGNYSVNDRVSDILENEDGYRILDAFFGKTVGMDMIMQAKNFKLAKLISKFGKMFPAEAAVKLNEELSKIPKPEEE